MRNSFPNRSQLSAMPISALRVVDIQEKDEEDLVQEILNAKVRAGAIQMFPKFQVPDIFTKEDEQKWQKKIDEENAKTRGTLTETPTEESEDVAKEIESVPVEEVKIESVETPPVEPVKKKGGRPKKVA